MKKESTLVDNSTIDYLSRDFSELKKGSTSDAFNSNYPGKPSHSVYFI